MHGSRAASAVREKEKDQKDCARADAAPFRAIEVEIETQIEKEVGDETGSSHGEESESQTREPLQTIDENYAAADRANVDGEEGQEAKEVGDRQRTAEPQSDTDTQTEAESAAAQSKSDSDSDEKTDADADADPAAHSYSDSAADRGRFGKYRFRAHSRRVLYRLRPRRCVGCRRAK